MTDDTGNVSLQPVSEEVHTTAPGDVSESEGEGAGKDCDCSCVTKEERGLAGGLGWAAGTAILIFAFSNTVIVAATLVITYVLYHVLITSVGILAPGMAATMAKFLAVFSL